MLGPDRSTCTAQEDLDDQHDLDRLPGGSAALDPCCCDRRLRRTGVAVHLGDTTVGAVSVAGQLEVAAITVNAVDLQTRSGRAIPVADARFPMVLGWDVTGTVAAVGADVTGWQVGDRAAAMVFQPKDQHGTYAERLNLDVGLLPGYPTN